MQSIPSVPDSVSFQRGQEGRKYDPRWEVVGMKADMYAHLLPSSYSLPVWPLLVSAAYCFFPPPSCASYLMCVCVCARTSTWANLLL